MGKAWLQPHICPSPNQCDPSPCIRSRTAVSGCFRWGPVAACHWLWFSRWGPGVRPTHCKMGQWISMTLPNVVEKGNRRFDRSWGKLGNLMLSTESEPLCHWISKKIRPENLVFDVEKVGNYRTLHISLEKPWFAAGFLKIFHKIPWLKKIHSAGGLRSTLARADHWCALKDLGVFGRSKNYWSHTNDILILVSIFAKLFGLCISQSIPIFDDWFIRLESREKFWIILETIISNFQIKICWDPALYTNHTPSGYLT